MVNKEFYDMADEIDDVLSNYYPGFSCNVNEIELNSQNMLTIKVNISNNVKVEERV